MDPIIQNGFYFGSGLWTKKRHQFNSKWTGTILNLKIAGKLPYGPPELKKFLITKLMVKWQMIVFGKNNRPGSFWIKKPVYEKVELFEGSGILVTIKNILNKFVYGPKDYKRLYKSFRSIPQIKSPLFLSTHITWPSTPKVTT